MSIRDLRLDLLRVIAMFGIVLIHAIYSTDIYEIGDAFGLDGFVVTVLFTAFFPMTNVFVLVSSYFLYESRFRWQKVVLISSVTIGYSVVTYMLLVAAGVEGFSLEELAECVFSPFNNQYWFITSYLGLYILSPYLNTALNALSKRELGMLCFLLFIGFSVIPSVLVFEPAQTFFDPRSGKSLIWFVVLYCFVFHFRKHCLEDASKIKARCVLALFAISVLALLVSFFALHWVSIQFGMGGDGQMRWYFDSSVFVVAASCSAFLLALKLKASFGQQSVCMKKGIVFLSGSTLGVYLLHEQPALKELLWNVADRYFIQVFSAHSVAVILLAAFVFLVGCLVENSRKLLSRKALLLIGVREERR